MQTTYFFAAAAPPPKVYLPEESVCSASPAIFRCDISKRDLEQLFIGRSTLCYDIFSFLADFFIVGNFFSIYRSLLNTTTLVYWMLIFWKYETVLRKRKSGLLIKQQTRSSTEKKQLCGKMFVHLLRICVSFYD